MRLHALPSRLTFAKPVCGPLALDHSSHFGLGLFTATDIHGYP